MVPIVKHEDQNGGKSGTHGHAGWGGVTVHGMQGTVSEFDPQTRAGALLLDDGTPLGFDAAAFDASGLRLVRLGQRVQIERASDGSVTRITIPTMHDQ
jgi:hypothetical protein